MTSRDADLVKYYNELAVRIWKVYPPILLVIGTLGNAMSIVVLSRKAMRRSNAATYLIVLSVVDIMVLYTGLLRQWLLYYFHIDIRHYGNAMCKTHAWLVYSSLDMSTWVLVALTFERLISVYLPHRVKKHCTMTTSLVSLGVIGIVSLTVNSHFFYGIGDKYRWNNGKEELVSKCTFVFDDYYYFGTKVWPWIDLCLYSLVPLSIIVICNIAIVIKVLISRRRARRVQPVTSVTFHGSTQFQDSSSKKISSMTAILVVLNMVLLVTTTPVSVYLIVEPYFFPHGSTKTRAEMKLAWAVTNMLQYTNNSINFILYCLSGSRFREELRAVFQRPRRVAPNNVTNTNVSDVPMNRFRSFVGFGRSRSLRVQSSEYNVPSNTTMSTQFSSNRTSVLKPSTVTLQPLQLQVTEEQLEEHQQQEPPLPPYSSHTSPPPSYTKKNGSVSEYERQLCDGVIKEEDGRHISRHAILPNQGLETVTDPERSFCGDGGHGRWTWSDRDSLKNDVENVSRTETSIARANTTADDITDVTKENINDSNSVDNGINTTNTNTNGVNIATTTNDNDMGNASDNNMDFTAAVDDTAPIAQESADVYLTDVNTEESTTQLRS